MKVNDFLKALKELGLGPVTGVPDSIFLPLVNCLEQTKAEAHYICSSEGEAMGLAAGFALAGRLPVVYMQNDGYGNAVNPLSSLLLVHKLPCLMLISWRAEPGTKDEPQHFVMGETIRGLLDLFKIPYLILGKDSRTWREDIRTAKEHLASRSTPFALIIRRGAFEPHPLPSPPADDQLDFRYEYIRILDENTDPSGSVLLGATGYCGRELYQMVKGSHKFYMMGAMGCLGAIGLGIAREHPEKTVFILDGDGAVLMKMGSLSTIGYHAPDNLVHICFDNGQYESTGGQPTTSGRTDLAAVARACGYRTGTRIDSAAPFKKLLKEIRPQQNPHFVLIKIKPGTVKDLPRPARDAVKMKTDFMEALNRTCKPLPTR